jgi:hypothetical protein
MSVPINLSSVPSPTTAQSLASCGRPRKPFQFQLHNGANGSAIPGVRNLFGGQIRNAVLPNATWRKGSVKQSQVVELEFRVSISCHSQSKHKSTHARSKRSCGVKLCAAWRESGRERLWSRNNLGREK